MKRFCIIGINYDPEVTGCAPYNSDMARMLKEAGHDVVVVTGLPHYPAWSVPAEYRGRLRIEEEIDGIRVIRAWHYVPKSMNALSRGLYELTFLVNGWWQSRRLNPDVVISTSPAWADTAIGVAMKRRGAVLKILVQDLMAAAAEQSNIAGGSLVSKIVEKLEGWSLRNADSVGVITEAFLKRVLLFGVDEAAITLAPNYAQSHVMPMDRDECRDYFGWSKDDFIVMHTGNMGLKQDLGQVIEAARLLEQSHPHISFKLVGGGSDENRLKQQAVGLSNVEFLPLVTTTDYAALLAAADLLLLHELATQFDMSLPSKLTSYAASSRPILAVGAFEGATHRAIRELHAGRFISGGNPAALAEEIVHFSFSVATQSSSNKQLYGLRNQRLSWAATADW